MFFSFIPLKLFLMMSDTLDFNGTMFIYGICCVAAAIFILVVFKETSGKLLDDIQIINNKILHMVLYILHKI